MKKTQVFLRIIFFNSLNYLPALNVSFLSKTFIGAFKHAMFYFLILFKSILYLLHEMTKFLQKYNEKKIQKIHI